MHKLLLSAAASLSLLAAPMAVAQPPSPEVQEAMQFACAVLDYDCAEVPVPELRYYSMFYDYGWFGVYFPNEPYVIYVDSDIGPILDPVFMQSVVVHEITHYLDQILVYGLGNPMPSCVTEWNAWRVANAYVVLNDREEWADYDWPIRYGCTFGE